ncbi:MAG: IS21 family transposase [Verrucomicrobiia bacterium]
MRQIKEVLRLKHAHQLLIREIARSCGLPSSTVNDYLARAQAAALSWPLPEGLDDQQIQQQLLGAFQGPPEASPPAEPPRPLPDWAEIHKELGRRSVTLRLLWQEYRERFPNGYGYTQFCEYYHRWAETLDPVMRHHHAPGEKMFVDWAGHTIAMQQADGSIAEASLFIAVLGASNKTFAEAFPDQKLPSWIAAHCHAYAYFDGVARVTVPDNPKTGVIKPCRYEPLLHRTYQEMAEHYGTVIIPARPRRPRDKAKAEGHVLIAERQILAALRDHTFFDVAGVNAALKPRLAKLNAQPFQKLDGSRDRWFETYEKPKLLPLPASAFELATWTKATVNIDYHVVVDKHCYSVPYPLIHQTLDVRLNASTVEFFQHGKRVAAHLRSSEPGKFTTLNEHRPKSHQKHLEWTPGRIVQWAHKTGPCCAELVRQIMESRPHPEQGFRACLGIIRLGKGAGQERLEAACRRALHFGTCSYHSVESILKRRLDQQPLEQELPLNSPDHVNVRGREYYH